MFKLHLRGAQTPCARPVWTGGSAGACVVILLLWSSMMAAQAVSANNAGSNSGISAELAPGIVVEKVAKGLAAEKAGIRTGDILLRWSRGDLQGSIDSPFDLTPVEFEQAKRAPVVLIGARGAEQETWSLGANDWGLQTRPNFQGSLLSAYQRGAELDKQDQTREALARWKELADQVAGAQPRWIEIWLLARVASVLKAKRQWKEADEAHGVLMSHVAEMPTATAVRLYQAWAGTFAERNDWANAVKYDEMALTEAKKLDSPSITLSGVITSLGIISGERGDIAKAENYFRQALAIQEQLAPGSLVTAATLMDLGNCAYQRGELAKAETNYENALAILRKVAPDSTYAATTLDNLGNVFLDRGDLSNAEANYQQGLAIRERLSPDSLDHASSLHNMANVFAERGDLAKAEEYALRALQMEEKLAPGTLDCGNTLNILGEFRLERDDTATALEYYRRSLDIVEKLAPESDLTASVLANIAVALQDNGDLRGAEKYYQRALALMRKINPDSLLVARNLTYLASLLQAQAQTDKAEQYLLQALALQKKLAPDGIDIIWTLNGLGEAAMARKDVPKAGEYFNSALALEERRAPDTAIHASTLAALAGIKRHENEAAAALSLYERMVQTLDAQMTRLGGSDDARLQFRARQQDFYADYAALLVEQHQDARAFDVLERARARTLLETLATGHVDVRKGADDSLLARSHDLEAEIQAKNSRRITLLDDTNAADQVKALDKEISGLALEYQDVQSRIRSASPAYAALIQPEPLSAKQVQEQLLDSDTLMLEYSLGAESSLVFAVTQDFVQAWALPKRSEIESASRRVYSLLTARNRAVARETAAQREARLKKADALYSAAVRALSRTILAPVAVRLQHKRLLVVTDGVLAYIPFSILPEPQAASDGTKRSQPLIVNHEIVNLPSASVLALLRQQQLDRRPAPQAVVVVADPVFDRNDERVRGKTNRPATEAAAATARRGQIMDDLLATSYSSSLLARSATDLGKGRRRRPLLARLPFTRQEADAIMKVTPPGAGLQVLDFRANRTMAVSPELAQYRVVHFATHGLLDSTHPELSGLVFSLVDEKGRPQDGFLGLQDVYNLNLPAELVVLSACETGLGKEIRGEGLIGLTRGFMYAGANRVVSSLWNVSDVATSRLMASFYQSMNKDGLAPAAALRSAQIQMSKQSRWNAPYFWAAFQIHGEWK